MVEFNLLIFTLYSCHYLFAIRQSAILVIMQQLTPLDHLIINFDHGLRTLFGQPLNTARPNPAQFIPEAELSET